MKQNEGTPLSSVDQDPELEDRIDRQVLDFIFQGIPKTAVSTLMFPLIVIGVMWTEIDHGLLVVWGLLVLAVIVLRYVVAKSYLRHDIAASSIPKWGRRYSVMTFYSALLWAAAAFLFYPDESVPHQVFLFSLVIGLSVGAITVGISWLPAFYLAAVPMIGAMIVRLLMEGSVPYIALAVLLSWHLLFSISITRKMHESMRSEMRLRHQSTALAEALQIKTAEAQQAVLAKSKFLAAASHDLRQPLHSLSLLVDALKEVKQDAERAHIFPRIDLSLNALRKLFDALLDVSRLDANVITPEFSHFDVAEVLRSLAEEFSSAAAVKGLKLKLHVRSAMVVSDRLLLERVLRNLISNAIRYTESGGVLLAARRRGESVLVQVWDSGIGIPEESQEEVFGEFQQLHNAHRDRAQGLGLGLSIVRRLCDLLGHFLLLNSRPGHGSVFSLILEKGDPVLASEDQAMPIVQSWDLGGRRILVIDDQQEILDAMATLLGKWGCQVIIAESLHEALAQLEQQGVVPELILSDLRLRDPGNGIQAIDALRQQYGDAIPGILITGDTAPEQLNLVKQSAYPVLQKPVQPARLRAAIHQQLSVGDRLHTRHLA